MASIFTYESDIPRVSSPWLKQLETTAPKDGESCSFVTINETAAFLDESGNVTRLGAEPQEGPVEYKLHLLLRPRRNFTSMSTVAHVSGSRHSKFNGPAVRASYEATPPVVASSPAATQQTRQHRLEQLTTQLLWRLQQSSPHHSSSATNVVLPHFPENVTELQPPPKPAKLLHGLEESQGALYEIGVSDDGTFVGLTEDEMQESLNNLRAMAASLGCIVEVQRMVDVGRCGWIEETGQGRSIPTAERNGRLFVGEALVKPHLMDSSAVSAAAAVKNGHHRSLGPTESRTNGRPQQPLSSSVATQLRISLTGATMSGKSSLLGALSTSTLDNGRGKSRLSMLKHRHEITSGITSSVVQELLGYRNLPNGDVEVINYATENISSWIDMHAISTEGRLVFISDSAGHPRYRRTTVRGLVGWNPHWTLLCIPADNEGDSSGRMGSTPSPNEILGPAASDVDLSAAHLDLCLRLGLPLIVAITKLDLASKTGLRLTLTKLLSALKAAGKKPILIPNSPGTVAEEDLQTFSNRKLSDTRNTIRDVLADPTSSVPIVMTSAVQGAGFDNLHAILHELPIVASSNTPATFKCHLAQTAFHIEDVYNKTLDAQVVVVSGHMRRGTMFIGDELVLGPCSSSSIGEDSEDSDGQPIPRRSSNASLTSRSFPGALKSTSLLARSKAPEEEWRRIKVVSVRNLRLPVSTLHADQVGTIGLQLLGDRTEHAAAVLSSLKIRKGMVLCEGPATPTSTLVAQFRREDLGSLAVGSQVVLYIASIRASARILSCRIPEADELTPEDIASQLAQMDVNDAAVEAGMNPERVAGAVTHDFLLVSLHFEAAKEYIEVGSKILVMPGGGPGLYGGTERGEKGIAGLEGFVGRVTEVAA